MRNIEKLALGLNALVLLLIAGCTDNNNVCYYCYAEYGGFRAVRGTDTIGFYAVSKVAITDSINHYTNMGYRIDTFTVNTQPYPNYGDETCGSNYNNLIALGDSCSLMNP